MSVLSRAFLPVILSPQHLDCRSSHIIRPTRLRKPKKVGRSIVAPEQPTKTPVKPACSETRGAECGAPEAACPVSDAPADPDLTIIVTAWPTLPEPDKARVVAMVKAAVLGIVQGSVK